MGLRLIAIIWFLSVLPLALGWASDGALVFGGALQVGPVLLPWIFLAGLPRQAQSRRVRTAVLIGLAVPPLALALGLDLADGISTLALARFVGVGLFLMAAYSHAANRVARRGRRLAQVYSVAWLISVPLPALLFFLYTQGGQPGLGGAPGAWALGSSPLTLMHALARGVDPRSSAWFVAALVVAGFWLLSRGRSDGGEGARQFSSARTRPESGSSNLGGGGFGARPEQGARQ